MEKKQAKELLMSFFNGWVNGATQYGFVDASFFTGRIILFYCMFSFFTFVR